MKRQPTTPPEILSSESEHLYELLNSGPDTSVIVVGVSYIDACLASLLSKRLLESKVTDKLLDPRSGAVGSFSARSDLVYALGLIDKSLYQDLLVLGELRNEAAHHHFALSFSSEQVVQNCEKLKYVAEMKTLGGEKFLDGPWMTQPRSRFAITAAFVVNRLLLTALGTSHAEPPA